MKPIDIKDDIPVLVLKYCFFKSIVSFVSKQQNKTFKKIKPVK